MTHTLLSLIDFYLRADTINKVHSPFLYELISKAFDMKKTYYADSRIEARRAELANRTDKVSFIDYGAKNKGDLKTVRVSKLMSSSVSNKWKCRFLRNLVLVYQPNHIIEFGTNLGISTAYLRSAKKKAQFTTVEAAEALVEIAQSNLKLLGYSADFRTMTFDDYIRKHPAELTTCDFFYLDGDHSYEGTLRYFKAFWQAGPGNMMIVLDDINWSLAMRRAWEEIKQYANCYSIDIYKMGIIVKRPDLRTSIHKKIVPRMMKPWQFGFFS